jgi:iron complex outermembrane receptor protein
VHRRSYFALILVLILVTHARGETVRGVVTDASGAPVRGALVQLMEEARVAAETRSAGDGAYLLALPAHGARPREARIRVEANGFERAEEFVPVGEGSLIRQDIVLRVSPYRQSMEVQAAPPAGDASLDMTGLRESAARDLGEAAAALDGVWKLRKAGIANDLVIRGFQRGNLNVLVDGSRTYGACPSHMDPPAQHVDFAQVDHVEVTKGAFDVTNQGSLGAVVNIVTKSPGMGFQLRPTFSTGSFGFVNPAVTASYGTERFRVLTGYSYRSSDPYKDGSGKYVTDYAPYSLTGKRERSFDIHTGWVETQLNLTDRQQLSFGYTRQQSGLVLYPYLQMDSDYDNADRGTFRYSARDLSSGLRNFRMEGYFTQVQHFMSNSQRSGANGGAWTMAADASSRVIGGRVEADLANHITWGFESFYRKWDVLGTMLMGGMPMVSPSIPDVSTQSTGTFVTFERSLTEFLKIKSGARFDHAHSEVGVAGASTDYYYQFHNTRNTSATDNYASGHLRLSFAIPRAGESYVGVGSNGRIPDAQERFISRGMGTSINVGNPNLRPTRNTELSAGWNYVTQRFYLRPSLFYSYLDNFVLVNNQMEVNPLNSGGMGSGGMGGGMGTDMPSMDMGTGSALFARSYRNVDARMYGGELGYGVTLTSTLSLNGGASYTRGRAAMFQGDPLNVNLPEIPPFRAWSALRYATRWMFGEFGTTVVNRQSLVNTNLQEVPTAGYGLLNAKIGFTLEKFSVSATMDNLTNRFYYEHLSYFRDPFAAGVKIPEPGRNLFLQVRYNF